MQAWLKQTPAVPVSFGCDIEDEDPDFEDLVGGFGSERIELGCLSCMALHGS